MTGTGFQEQRGLTVGGTRLRDALTAIQTAEQAATGGKSLVMYGVYDVGGAEIGAARLDAHGWSVEGAVKVAVRDGRLDPGVRVTFRKRIT